MAVTIHDIAKKIGVSPSTVSRVINGKGVISEETRKKILAAMEELNYYPNSVARNLATGSSQAIGLIINAFEDNQAFSNFFFNRSVFGIERVLQANKYNLIISSNYEETGRLSPVEKLVYEHKVDGLILPPSTVTPKLVKKLIKQDFPFVVLGEPPQFKNESSWVDVNNLHGSELAIQHLALKGYKKIAFIGGSQKEVYVSNRIEGFRLGLANNKLPINEAWIAESSDNVEESFTVAKQLLEGEERPDAFLCNTNMVAFGVIKAVKTMGLQIPQDVGIITFDNYPLAGYTEPPLTVIDIDTYILGEQAASILLQRIKKNCNNQQLLINTTLIERTSTKRER